MFSLSLPHPPRRSMSATRPTTLHLEQLETRDLLAAHPLGNALPPVPPAHESAVGAPAPSQPEHILSGSSMADPSAQGLRRDGFIGQPFSPAPPVFGGRGDTIPLDRPATNEFVLVYRQVAVSVESVTFQVANGSLATNASTLNSLVVGPSSSTVLNSSKLDQPATSPQAEAGNLSTSDSVSSSNTASTPRLLALNQQVSSSQPMNSAATLQSINTPSPAATAANLTTAQVSTNNTSALRSIAAVLLSASRGATPLHPAPLAADLVFRSAATSEPAMNLAQLVSAGFGYLPGGPAVSKSIEATLIPDGTVANPLAAQPPWLADLLSTPVLGNSTSSMLVLEQLLPEQTDGRFTSRLTSLLRSPYLPGTVAALIAVEVFRRHMRRNSRRSETTLEIPEITGPRSL